jgi:hypothetical protein
MKLFEAGEEKKLAMEKEKELHELVTQVTEMVRQLLAKVNKK